MSFDWPDDYTVEKRIGIGKEIPLQALDVIGNISATGDISADTNLDVSGNIQLGGNLQFTTGLAISEFSDDGNLTDSSSSALPTEQAVKTYIDEKINQVNSDLSTKALLHGSKTEDFHTRKLTVHDNLELKTGVAINEFSNDGELSGNTDLAVPTEQAVKTYVDNQIKTRAALNGAPNQDFATQNLTVDGNLTVGHAIATQQLSVSGGVTGSLTIENDLTVGHAIATKQLSVSDAVKGSLTVENDLTVNNAIATQQLSVSDAITGSLTIENDLIVDGFRLRYDPNFFGSNIDALVVEKTDGNDPNPDGGIAFVNTGNDGVVKTALVIRGNGNVGIGTSHPQGKLEVAGALKISSGELNINNPGEGKLLAFLGTERPWQLRQFGTGASTALQLASVGDGGNKDLLISTNGRVGIGTTNPQAKLEVAGALKLSTTGTLLFHSTNESGNPNSDGFRLRYDHNFFGTNLDALVIEKTDGNDPNPDGGIAFVNTGNDGVVETALVIRGNGNVGIGTDNPSQALDVIGNIAASGNVQANKFVGDGSQLTNLNRWSLAYAHNANGERTEGNLNDLINALQNGSQVRILIDGSNREYITYAENIWIKNGIVYLQNTSHVSVTFDGDVMKFQDNSYWFMIIVSTKGDRDIIRWNVGEHTPRGHTNDKVAVKWFID